MAVFVFRMFILLQIQLIHLITATHLTPSKRIDAVYAYGDLTYKDALTLSASFRNDWSSTLTYANGSGDYTYSYPSVGLAWIATEIFERSAFMAFIW